MNWLDGLLIGVFVISLIAGFGRGLIRESIGLAALVLGVIFGVRLYGDVADFLGRWVVDTRIASILGFLIVLSAFSIAGAIVGRIIAGSLHTVGVGWLDRLAGAGFGAVRGVLLAIALLMILMAFPSEHTKSAIVSSRLAPGVAAASHALSTWTPPELKEAFARNYEEVRRAWYEMWEQRARRLPETVI